MVEIFPVEFIQDWVQQNSLLVDRHHRVGRYLDPVVYDNNTELVLRNIGEYGKAGISRLSKVIGSLATNTISAPLS